MSLMNTARDRADRWKREYDTDTYFKSMPLDLSSLALSELPPIPKEVRHLYCFDNRLVSLPKLPEGLEVLFCSRNMLRTLPKFPKSLTVLDVSQNPLQYLLEIPKTLTAFWCINCDLETLPAIPDGLERLWCSSNRITRLPQLPNTLQGLWCYSNRLTSIPSPPASIHTMRCFDNDLIYPQERYRNLDEFKMKWKNFHNKIALRDEMERVQERNAAYKEELIATVWNPCTSRGSWLFEDAILE